MSAEPPAKAPAAPRTDKLAEALSPGTRFGLVAALEFVDLRDELELAGPRDVA